MDSVSLARLYELNEEVDAFHAARMRALGEEYAAFMAASNDLLCVVDSEGIVRRANEQWRRVLGCDPTGRFWLDLVAMDDAARAAEALADGGHVQDLSCRMVGCNGFAFVICWGFTVLGNGRRSGVGRVCVGASVPLHPKKILCALCPSAKSCDHLAPSEPRHEPR
jgi:PAS domain-containing protein